MTGPTANGTQPNIIEVSEFAKLEMGIMWKRSLLTDLPIPVPSRPNQIQSIHLPVVLEPSVSVRNGSEKETGVGSHRIMGSRA